MAEAGFELDPAHVVGKFYRGTILRLRQGSRTGVIRSAATGRPLSFDVTHVRLVGPTRPEDLREGATVGYDVSWTQRGLRVSVLWVPRSEESAAS